jgi:hypothetical protein
MMWAQKGLERRKKIAIPVSLPVMGVKPDLIIAARRIEKTAVVEQVEEA